MMRRREPGSQPLASVRQALELIVYIQKDQGTIDRVLRILEAASVNVLARCSYADCFKSTMLLVVDKPELARITLEGVGYHTREQSVVVVEATRGAVTLHRLADRLADVGIDVVYSYVSPRDADGFCAVFKTMDDSCAIAALREVHPGSAPRERLQVTSRVLLEA